MTTEPEHRMQRLCSSDRPNQLYPFQLDAAGRSWAVATDGTMFVAVAPANGEPTTKENISKTLGRFIAAEVSDHAIETTAEAIMVWTGPACWEFPCPTCKGTGKVPAPNVCSKCDGDGYAKSVCMECSDVHECECQQCGGTGDGPDSDTETVACDDCEDGKTDDLTAAGPEPGAIAGVTVDKRRLARLLTVVSGDCQVWSTERAMHARGAGWHMTLMELCAAPLGEAFEKVNDE